MSIWKNIKVHEIEGYPEILGHVASPQEAQSRADVAHMGSRREHRALDRSHKAERSQSRLRI